jgi:hypothetical protein
MIGYFLYASECSLDPFSIDELNIVQSSATNNAKLGLSGFLHRSENNFFQYLEGGAPSLISLEKKLRLDERHTKFSVLKRGELSHPFFPNWSMGYSTDKDDIPGLPSINRTDTPSSIIEALISISDLQTARYIQIRRLRTKI